MFNFPRTWWDRLFISSHLKAIKQTVNVLSLERTIWSISKIVIPVWYVHDDQGLDLNTQLSWSKIGTYIGDFTNQPNRYKNTLNYLVLWLIHQSVIPYICIMWLQYMCILGEFIWLMTVRLMIYVTPPKCIRHQEFIRLATASDNIWRFCRPPIMVDGC